MEMESIQPDHDDGLAKETDAEQLVCAAGSLNICGVSGFPNLSPRIGDDYQVKIPPLESQSDAISDASLRFLEGLPISIMLIHDKIDSRAEQELRLLGGNSKTSSKSGKSKKHNNATEKTGSKLKDEPLDDDKSVNFEKKRKALDKAGSKLKDEPLDDEPIHCEKKHKASEKVGSKIKDELLDNGPAVHCEKNHKAIENVGSKQKDGQINDGSSAHFEKKKHNSMEKVGSKLEDEPLNERSVKPQKANSERGSKTYFVPGSLGGCWNEDEVESFILGLYIFGKSFVPIKKFVDTKDIGDILSFYYGRFYGSDRYKRWSDCRKVKRRKCVSGDKLFTGWRQQELISRLQPHFSESYQKTSQEVSEAMSDGKIPLEDYASSLKAAVGIQVLVEAIGIGKGKEDLTNPAMESMKTNPATTKSCSSLTPNDIVTLLTGGFRLSKARCTDIFWEAVWPRLLARGWHSEQPNNLNYLDAKTNLVFLVPGVKKYSRRDLVKGFHYFDSVADVLSRVASEPELLELQEADEENKDDSGVSQSRNYLKPRVSNGNPKSMKFTVVDSSSVNGEGEGLVKVKRMRYSPRDLVVTSMVTRISGMRGSLLIEDSKEEEDEEKQNPKAHDTMMMIDETKTKAVPNTDKVVATSAKFTIVDTSRGKSSSSKIFELRHLPSGDRVTCRWIKLSDENRKIAHDDKVDGDGALHRKNKIHGSKELPPQQAKTSSNTVKTPCKEVSDLSNESQSTKPAAPVQQFSRRPKLGHLNNSVPLVKRRRLTACISTEMSHAIGSCDTVKRGAKEKKIFSGLDSSKTVKKNTLKVIFGPESKLSSSSAEGCADEEGRGGVISKINVSYTKGEAAESLPDLNLQPQRQLDSELVEKPESVTSETRNLDPGEMPSNNHLSTNLESRRQSTRNRPLTTRALEALQYEFLDVRKRPRSSQQESGSSSSRRARSKKIKVTSSSKLDVIAEEEKVEDCSGGGSSIEEPAVVMDPESCSSR